MTQPTLPVLMYHSVSSAPDGALRDLAVPPQRLREQLTALVTDGFALLGLTEALARKAASPDTRVVALTFDDGYRDFLTAGLLVLREVGASATLYVSVGHLGPSAAPMATTAAFGPLLSWAEVREVGAAGIEIGSHSMIHRPMDVLPRPVLEAQVRDSRDRLEQEVSAPVISFAYPHGYNSRRVRAAVARHGYRNACEVGHRLHRMPGDVYAVPRLLISPDHTGPDTLAAVRTGGPALVPALKRAAHPAWRITRWVADRAFNRTLT